MSLKFKVFIEVLRRFELDLANGRCWEFLFAVSFDVLKRVLRPLNECEEHDVFGMCTYQFEGVLEYSDSEFQNSGEPGYSSGGHQHGASSVCDRSELS